MDGDEPEITAIARELYSIAPQDFVARRNETAKGLGKPLAPRVRALTKPTPAAWLVDQLSRERGRDLTTAIALGSELQHAQDEADRVLIQRLSKQHRETVRELTAVARDLATDAHVSTSAAVLDEVAHTISAAMSDSGAAAAVRTGLLITALQSSGLERVDLTGTLALPELVASIQKAQTADATTEGTKKAGASTAAAERRALAKRQKADEERRRERAHADVQRRVDRAQATVERATRQLDELDEAREQKASELASARDELAALLREIDDRRG